MPLCTLHLLALYHTNPDSLPNFLSALKSSNVSPLVVSRVIRWIILPMTFSTEHLLARNIHWDLLIVLPSVEKLPRVLQEHVEHQWCITAGVPSRLTQDFAPKNRKLLQPEPGAAPALSGALNKPKTTDSAQDLELSSELSQWIHDFYSSGSPEGKGAVSMFNLLSFNPTKKSSYLQYGKAFATSIGVKHGGNAKIVGGVTSVNGRQRDESGGDGSGWDEIALAHYPSIMHFADMLVDKEYQEVNQKHRVPSLRDTAILMTSEVGVRELMENLKGKL